MNAISERKEAMSWWNTMTLEQKLYKVIPWLKSQGINVTERHPNSMTGREIQACYEFHKSKTP